MGNSCKCSEHLLPRFSQTVQAFCLTIHRNIKGKRTGFSLWEGINHLPFQFGMYHLEEDESPTRSKENILRPFFTYPFTCLLICPFFFFFWLCEKYLFTRITKKENSIRLFCHLQYLCLEFIAECILVKNLDLRGQPALDFFILSSLTF